MNRNTIRREINRRAVVSAFSALAVMLLFAAPSRAASDGISIEPDEKGVFEYVEDFETPKFLREAFLDNLGPESWSKGSVFNYGPNRDRTLTYRFHGARLIKSIDVQVQQRANGRNLGGKTYLYLSRNGLDWTLVDDTGKQKGDANGFQAEPLAPADEHKEQFAGGTETWVRVVMDNYSGLKTNTSNTVSRLSVKLETGDVVSAEALLPAGSGTWAALRREAGWRSITLDWADPPDARAPHYYEDSDGWLQAHGANPNLAPDETDGFPVHRSYSSDGRLPLSLAAFVHVRQKGGPIAVRITARRERGSSRKMRILWNGTEIGAFDAASYFEKDSVFLARVPGEQDVGIHELRLTSDDCGRTLIRQIAVAGPGYLSWSEKPPLPGPARVEVLSAYYMPDPPPPPASQAVEGRHAKQELGLIFAGLQRLYKEHAEFGGLRVVLRNSGAVPARVSGLKLNGRPVEDSYVNFARNAWDARGVVWSRVRPRLIEPGCCAQVYIRFRRRPKGAAAEITVQFANADPLNVRVPYSQPGACIDYVTTGKTGDELYVYARSTAGQKPTRVTALRLDAEAVKGAELFGAEFPGALALAKAKLPAALKPGEYHVVGVKTDSGGWVDAQFRVQRFWFPRSSIHVPVESCKDMSMNLAMWHERSLEDCTKYGVYTTSSRWRNMFDMHERVAFIMGPDEPDAHDNRGAGYSAGLGHNARLLAHSGWQELIERRAPHTASWIIMNGTTRSLNWAVYGQFADVACFDPYPINFYAADHPLVRESLSYARQCGRPNRMYACLEAFGWGKGQGVPKNARGPMPAEYRQNVVQAIGCGAKGLTSWVYSACAGGWQINKPATEEIAKTNALIGHIESELILGTPVDLAQSDAGLVPTGTVTEAKWPKDRVWVSSLLCGPDAIVVAAANHIPASKPEPPTIAPAKNVTITVRLPGYLREVKAFEATPEGLKPFPCSLEEGRALLKLESIESGRVFVLRRK